MILQIVTIKSKSMESMEEYQVSCVIREFRIYPQSWTPPLKLCVYKGAMSVLTQGSHIPKEIRW